MLHKSILHHSSKYFKYFATLQVKVFNPKYLLQFGSLSVFSVSKVVAGVQHMSMIGRSVSQVTRQVVRYWSHEEITDRFKIQLYVDGFLKLTCRHCRPQSSAVVLEENPCSRGPIYKSLFLSLDQKSPWKFSRTSRSANCPWCTITWRPLILLPPPCMMLQLRKAYLLNTDVNFKFMSTFNCAHVIFHFYDK